MGEIVKLGGDRKFLNAKIFGSSHRSEIDRAIDIGIVSGNISFLHEYFKLEKIKVEKEDFEGNYRRKIYFYPQNGLVYRKILENDDESAEFIRLEMGYIDRVFNSKDKYGEVILF